MGYPSESGLTDDQLTDLSEAHTHDNKNALDFITLTQVAILNQTTVPYDNVRDTKLSGISENATRNSSDSYLLNRKNHTGVPLGEKIIIGEVRMDSGGTVTLNGWKWSSGVSVNNITQNTDSWPYYEIFLTNFTPSGTNIVTLDSTISGREIDNFTTCYVTQEGNGGLAVRFTSVDNQEFGVSNTPAYDRQSEIVVTIYAILEES